MAAALGSSDRHRLIQQGWELMAPEQALNALDLIWQQDASQVAVLPINRWRFVQQFVMGNPLPVLAELARTTAQPLILEVHPEAPPDNLLERLQETPPSEHHAMVVEHLQERVSKVLGLVSSQRPGVHKTLQELGLDSLMQMELRNYVITDLEVNVPMEKLSAHIDIGSLSDFLLEQLTLNRIVFSGQPSPDSPDDMEELTL
jgi:polyketide synthase 12/myxalamid-type polyketide synthase MxaB